MAELVATKSTSRTASQCAHQTSIALSLRIRVCRAVLLRIAVRIGGVLTVWPLLRELALGRAGLAIAAMLVLLVAAILLGVWVGIWLLAVLVTGLLRRPVVALLRI